MLKTSLARLEVIRETSAPSSNMRVAVREPEPESNRATAILRIDLQGRKSRSAAATFTVDAETFVTALESRVVVAMCSSELYCPLHSLHVPLLGQSLDRCRVDRQL